MIAFMTKEMKEENKIEISKSLDKTKELISEYLKSNNKKLKYVKSKLNRAKSQNLKSIYTWEERYKSEKANYQYISRVIIPKCDKILKAIENGDYEVNIEDSLKDDMVIHFAFIDFSAIYIDNKLNIHIWSKKDGVAVLKILTIGDGKNEIRIQE